MAVDYSELLGLIKRYFGTQDAFAKAIGLSAASLSGRLKGHTPFKQLEILRAKEALHLDPEDVDRIFFSPEIRKNEQEVH